MKLGYDVPPSDVRAHGRTVAINGRRLPYHERVATAKEDSSEKKVVRGVGEGHQHWHLERGGLTGDKKKCWISWMQVNGMRVQETKWENSEAK